RRSTTISAWTPATPRSRRRQLPCASPRATRWAPTSASSGSAGTSTRPSRGRVRAHRSSGGPTSSTRARTRDASAPGPAVRQAAREVLGTDERVFRIGGDEFAVLAPKGQGEQVVRRAQELFQGVEAGGFRTGLRGAVGETFEQADEGVRRLKASEGPRYRG